MPLLKGQIKQKQVSIYYKKKYTEVFNKATSTYKISVN